MILNRLQLKEKLNILSKAYSQKTPQPALQFVKFDNDTLTMSNGSVVIISQYESGIQALIPFKQLNDICSKLTADELDLTINDNQAVIKCGRSRYTLNIGDFNDYPLYSVLSDGEQIKINSNAFKRCISKINFACGKNEKRPILTGINFGEFAVSTDAFKLARYDETFGLNCTIASSDISNLISILNTDEVLVRNNKHTATFEFGDTIYQTRLLEGNYPDTSRLIADYFAIKCKIGRVNLINAIDRASIFSNEEYNTIKLSIDKYEITINSASNQVGNAVETIDCESNDYIKIACNSEYLLEALAKFNDDYVTLLINGELKPFVIKEKELTALILPVKVSE